MVGSLDVVEEVKAAGVDVVEEDPDIVYLTFDRTITYEKINKAYKALMKGAELIATHPDDVCPTETDYDIDIGPFIRMFEQMCQTKAVIIGKPNRLMLEMAAKEMGVRNIRHNAIAPGFIITAMTDALPEDVRKAWESLIPLRRGGTPEDVANVALFLASDLSSYVTGQVIHCCGGMNC